MDENMKEVFFLVIVVFNSTLLAFLYQRIDIKQLTHIFLIFVFISGLICLIHFDAIWYAMMYKKYIVVISITALLLILSFIFMFMFLTWKIKR